MENINIEPSTSKIEPDEGIDEVCCQKIKPTFAKPNGAIRKNKKQNHQPTINVEETRKQKSSLQMFALLYAYNYFLNYRWSKCISIGYCPDTFQIKFLLNDCVNEGRVILTQFEWGGLYHSLQKIMKSVQSANNELNEVLTGLKTGVNSYSKQRVKITPLFSVVIEQTLKEVVVILQHNHVGIRSSITLSYQEWCTLYMNMEFLNTVSEDLKYNTIIVISYFEQYVMRCVENVSETTDFFVPLGISPAEITRYSRLFNEFPVLCKDNIQRLVKLEKQARGLIV